VPLAGRRSCSCCRNCLRRAGRSYTSTAAAGGPRLDNLPCVRARAVRLSQLGVARFTRKYPAVLDALLRTMLDVVCKYQRTISG